MSAADAEEVTRLRKPRFSYEENQILIQEVRANYGRLYGSQSRRVTVADRRRVWEGIAAKINRITSWRRTGQEVQKRWNDFKRRTKEKLARVPHSTQGGGGTNSDEAYSAEEETIFAILGPGVVAGAGGMDLGSSLHHSRSFPQRFHLPPDQPNDIVDLPAVGKVSSSPETSANASCCAMEGGILQLKQRDSPPPPLLPEAEIQVIQLPQLAPSPDASVNCPLPDQSPTHNPRESPPRPGLSSSPVQRHHRSQMVLPLTSDPSLDFLQAQRETTEAIRDLAYTIRQSIDKLTNVVATMLPLFQHASTLVDSGLLNQSSNCNIPASQVSTAVAPCIAEGVVPPTAVASSHTFAGKLESSSEVETQHDRGMVETFEIEGVDCTLDQDKIIQVPISSTLRKRRGGYMSTRKRRGRWKHL